MQKKTLLYLVILIIGSTLQTQAQRLVLNPNGQTLYPNSGQTLTGFTIVNEGSLPTSTLNYRSGALILDQSKKEFSISTLGKEQSMAFYVRSYVDPGFPANSQLKILVDGTVILPDGIRIGGPAVAGAIRWNGTNFEGYNGSAWLPFKPSTTPVSYYTTAIQAIGNTYSNAPCQQTCITIGCTSIADSFGTTCQAVNGQYGNAVVVVVGTGYRCYYNNQDRGALSQCLCRCSK